MYYITRIYKEFFHEYGQSDLESVAIRDRNHPCIIQWSIGNEIEWTRALDTTRPITANCILPSVSYETGYTDALDIVGTSYRGVVYDYLIKNYPDKPIMGTENVPQYHEWKSVLDNPHIAGVFLWTGFDYLGEAHRYQWPQKGSGAGLVNPGGFKKPAYYLFKSLWQEESTLALYTNYLEDSLCDEVGGQPVLKGADGWRRRNWRWHKLYKHWNYGNGDKIIVEGYSNCDRVSLYLNGQLIGEQEKDQYADMAYRWLVPFSEGELKAVGVKNGEEIVTYLNTTGPIASIELSVDKEALTMDTDSAAHIVAQFKDAKGNDVNSIEDEVVFEISDSGKLLGVDNGSLTSVSDYQSDRTMTDEGHCLAIVQAIGTEPITVRAIAPKQGIKSEEFVISVIGE